MALNVLAEVLPRYPIALAAGTGIEITSAGGTRTIGLGASYGPFSTREQIKALLNPLPGQTAYLNERGREGLFVYRSGNYASLVSSDPREAIYLASDDKPTTSGAWVRDTDGGVLKLSWFGAVGDGTTDDTAAAQAWASMIRSMVSTDGRNWVKFVADASGGKWRITSPLNLTNIVAWNLEIRGGVWVLETAGKPGWDMVGTRGGSVNGVMWIGSRTSMPKCAWQAARTAETGACDKMSFIECTSIGYFSTSAYIEYGQEESIQVDCQWFNGHPDAYEGVHEGINTIAVTSDYATVITGGTSHINNTFIHCAWQYLPDEATSITAITKASNAQITVGVPGGFKVGDVVAIVGVGGMYQATQATATITGIAGNVITTNLNSSGFSTYTGGGVLVPAKTKPSVRVSRTSQMHFINCYMVNAGNTHLELVFDDPAFLVMNEMHFDILFEGAANAQNVAIRTGGYATTIRGFSLKTYASNATGAIIAVPNETGGSLDIFNENIASTSQHNAVPVMTSAGACPGRIRGGIVIQDVYVSGDNLYDLFFNEVNTNKIKYIDSKNGTSSVVVTSQSGTITAYTSSFERTCVSQNVTGCLRITMTTIGTATGALFATLPYPTLTPGVFFGRNSNTGAALIGYIGANSQSLTIEAVSGGAPLANGQSLIMSISYSTATP